jgi:hypothetical protein
MFSVIHHELMSVRGNHKRYIQPLRLGVQLGLFHSMTRRQILRLGFDQRYCHRLRFTCYFDSECVIHPPIRPLAWLTLYDLHCPSRLLAPNQLLRPAAGVEGRVNEFRASVRFGEGHEGSRWAKGLYPQERAVAQSARVDFVTNVSCIRPIHSL